MTGPETQALPLIEAPQFAETVNGAQLAATIRHHRDVGRIVVLLPDGMALEAGQEAVVLAVLGKGPVDVVYVVPREPQA